MLKKQIIRLLPSSLLGRLRRAKWHWQKRALSAARRRHPVTSGMVCETLEANGISKGDTVFCHSSLNGLQTFVGEPMDLVSGILSLVGDRGNLLMPSFPMSGTAFDHLENGHHFDVRRTPSKMGLLTEIFRLGCDVERSIHPTHSVIAKGTDARWLVDGHHLDATPFGPDSPFQRMLQLSAKVVMLGVGLRSLTLVHVAEDMLADDFPVRVYADKAFAIECFDRSGDSVIVSTRALNPALASYRDPEVLRTDLLNSKVLTESHAGGPILVLEACGALRVIRELALQQKTIYDIARLRRELGSDCHALQSNRHTVR